MQRGDKWKERTTLSAKPPFVNPVSNGPLTNVELTILQAKKEHPVSNDAVLAKVLGDRDRVERVPYFGEAEGLST